MKPTFRIGRIIAVVLCAILLVFMTVEIAHGHGTLADSSHCQLCAAAHLATDVPSSGLAPVFLLLLAIVSLGEISPGARAVLVTAFIRPPPASFQAR